MNTIIVVLIYLFANVHVNSQVKVQTDSLLKGPHDIYYDLWIKTKPFMYENPVQSKFFSSYQSGSNINISRDTFPQNEPSIKISRKNPNYVVAAWRDFRTGVEPAVRRIGYSYSTDGGITWAKSQLLPVLDSFHPRASDPAVCVDIDGNFYISTISLTGSNSNGTVSVFKSTNNGESFDQAFNIYPRKDTLYYDDKEYITCDLCPGSPYKNNIYVAWSSYYGNSLVRSTNAGLNWSERVIISTQGGGLGLVPVTGPNGEVYVGWVGSSGPTLSGIHMNKSTDGGLSFGEDILISEVEIGGFVIRLPSLAVDISPGARNGYIYAVWSDIYENMEDDEDVYFSFSSNGGASWSIPKRINDDIPGNGKRQYWPWISVNQNGMVSIVYFDTRNTSSLYFVETYLATSSDGGDTFNNKLISDEAFPVFFSNSDVRFGDYIGIDSWANKIIPVWTDSRLRTFDMDIYIAHLIDSTVSINQNFQKIPGTYSLLQNYPNPFNPKTNISYELPVTNYVSLTIYNALGAEIIKLVNQNQFAGTYQVEWNVGNFQAAYIFTV